ncbi:hypothetical protein [Rheinheimera sp. KL1]|uniref:hypothetical protein n=1 Tax=Rheinheimera sp. KL1 TaxID=1635005 RepID=UPI0006A98E61|nr:hypothetical protein [Rheinheimera sp. KL1]
MAKKLSVVQLKQQANVLKSLEVVEQAAAPLYPDFVGCWFSMEFETFLRRCWCVVSSTPKLLWPQHSSKSWTCIFRNRSINNCLNVAF